MSKFVVFNGSSRYPGNSSIIIEKVFSGFDAEAFRLKDFTITQYEDYRETDLKYKPVSDDYDFLINKFLQSDVAVFISPVYWYGISGTMKVFIDRFSESLKKIPDFRQRCNGKKIVLVVIGGDNPQQKADIITTQFQYICDFLGMTLCHTFKGEADRVGEIENQHEFMLSIKNYLESNFTI
ncbi:flavodoxin family protein [Kosakonia sp.]|uniref:flavodoxin family protein n=1 Tax=Kosakonia sp. TaxID=1916651 RepID=UPI00289AC4AC|nr:flavodoxin family protein [Kosakonia sp.]